MDFKLIFRENRRENVWLQVALSSQNKIVCRSCGGGALALQCIQPTVRNH